MSNVVEGDMEIVNALGLHARAAAQLVKLTNRFKSDVVVGCEGQEANAKSIMGVLMLAAAKGMTVHVRCRGEDAQACFDDIRALIAAKFGEPQ
ncbi:MAG: HPr family phosphocarrier protein [Myxococcaceae bacterium]|nr:HPr family phosphocarrier protein [Myxococcaceae bacterium]MCI0670818.1 HPr family phosphocarrier protein [Myxococcaceae bacterium]